MVVAVAEVEEGALAAPVLFASVVEVVAEEEEEEVKELELEDLIA